MTVAVVEAARAELERRRAERARARYLANPVLRDDYRTFDASKMTVWGSTMQPWPRGQRTRYAIWSTPRPRDGDLCLLGGIPHVIWDVDLCRDPDDMAFFTIHPYSGHLPLAAAAHQGRRPT